MNHQKVFATPKEGVLVRHEDGRRLAAAGEPVVRNSYWLRRERDGDVRLGPVPKAPAAAATTAAETPPADAAAAAKKTKG